MCSVGIKLSNASVGSGYTDISSKQAQTSRQIPSVKAQKPRFSFTSEHPEAARLCFCALKWKALWFQSVAQGVKSVLTIEKVTLEPVGDVGQSAPCKQDHLTFSLLLQTRLCGYCYFHPT
jgi:hypothetical protein